MSVRLRLAAFAVALAVTFTATFAAGNAFGPDDAGRPPPTTADPSGGPGSSDDPGPSDTHDPGEGPGEHAPGHGSEDGGS